MSENKNNNNQEEKNLSLTSEKLEGQSADYETQAPEEEKVSASVGDFLKDVVSDEKKSEDEETEDGKSKKKKKDKKDKKDKKPKKKTDTKQLKHGMMSTVLTVVFVAVVVLVNVIATILFERYPITIDLTSEKIYSISEESEEYVKKIDTDVLITVFSTEDEFTSLSTYTKQAAEVMKKYCQYNDKISYRFVDIDSNPDIVSEYETDSISTYDIVVETNPSDDVKRVRKIGLLDLLDFTDDFMEMLSQYGMSIETAAESMGGDITFLSYYGGYVESSTADQAFLSAFMTVTDPNPVNVVFLTGRDEASDLSYFRTLLEANGYTVSEIDITTEEIPDDATVAVIAAPQTDYLDAEIAKVDEFLDNDGLLNKQLLYCASLAQSDTPNLDEFLAEYGVEIGDGVVCETSSDYYYQLPYVTITTDVSDNFNQDMTTSNPTILNYYSRPITLLFDEEGMQTTEAYVQSTEKGYVADAQTGDTLEKGTQIYMAVASKAVFLDDGDTNYSNIIVLGSVDTLSDQFLSYSQFQNREYILSVLNGITHKTDGIVIEPKVIEGNVFDITDKQQSILKWTFIVIIPAVVLIIGGIIWMRRKNR